MYMISVVIEKEQSRVALFDKEYKLLLKKCGTKADVEALCAAVMAESGVEASEVDYIGVAADIAADAVAADLQKSTGIRCLSATLMGARALGEAYTANDVPSLFMLKVDNMVECGIVIEKKIFTGMHQLGGKIAHMVINFGGYECTCGRQGCFEAYAGVAGLKRIAAEAGVQDVETLTHATLFGMTTPEAECAQKTYVKYLAGGITNIINLFQPNELVLEGPFTEVGDKLMAPMMDIILREQYTHSMPNKCNVRFASGEQDTALLGAALLAR